MAKPKLIAGDRVKRGRGDIGSRIDETGPYLPPCQDSNVEDLSLTGFVIRKVYVFSDFDELKSLIEPLQNIARKFKSQVTAFDYKHGSKYLLEDPTPVKTSFTKRILLKPLFFNCSFSMFPKNY
ncbi:hypothetical protein AgCh_012785 [Apium graveolens]